MTTQHIGDEDELLSNQRPDDDSPEEPAEPPEPAAEHPEQPELAKTQSENKPPELAETPCAMGQSLLPAPTAFNVNATDLYNEWQHWQSAFEIYAIASDLAKKNDTIQRAPMLHCLGPTVQRIFHTLPCDHKSHNNVKTALSGYFVLKRKDASEAFQKMMETILFSIEGV